MTPPVDYTDVERRPADALAGVRTVTGRGPAAAAKFRPRHPEPARPPSPSLPPAVVIAVVAKTLAVGLWVFTPWSGWAGMLFVAGGGVVLYQLFVPWAGGICPVFRRFITEHREIWLTIDDGPDPRDTPLILDLLDRHKARATFFVIGRRAAAHPELVREILRRGHDVAHHTHTHPTGMFWCAARRRVAFELDEALHALRLAGHRPRFFRAPVGIKNLFLARALAERNLAGVAWSVRSGDWCSREPAPIARHVMRKLAPGMILLMHEGPGVSPHVRVQAIAQVLDGLAARGFRCVLPAHEQLR